MDFFEKIGKCVVDISQKCKTAIKNAADITQTKILMDKKEKRIAQIYSEIGRAYYEKHRKDMSDDEHDRISEIEQLSAEVSQCKEHIAQIKGVDYANNMNLAERGTRKKKAVVIVAAAMAALLLFIVIGGIGGGRGGIVGTWVSMDGREVLMFDKDGTCSVPFTYDGGWWESCDRYTIDNKGTLILSSSKGNVGPYHYPKARSKDDAEDNGGYYLSGKTLVIKDFRTVYTYEKES